MPRKIIKRRTTIHYHQTTKAPRISITRLILSTPLPFLWYLFFLPSTSRVITGIYILLVNIITSMRLVQNKTAATEGGRRVSEKELHGLELLGGFTASLIMQKALHHKINKLSYQVTFFTIVFLHQMVGFALCGGHFGWVLGLVFGCLWCLDVWYYCSLFQHHVSCCLACHCAPFFHFRLGFRNYCLLKPAWDVTWLERKGPFSDKA